MANSRNYRTPTDNDDPDVPAWLGRLAQDVASDADALEADISAVSAAVATKRAPLEKQDYLAVEVDRNYVLSRGVLLDGTQYIPRLKTAQATISNYPTIDYLRATVDKDGRIAEDALGADGRVPGWVLEAWAARMGNITPAPVVVQPSARGIICRGDSITAGAFGEGTSYPLELSKLRPELTIAKRGYPGETSPSIAQRHGSMPLMVTVTGGIIPASGPVSIAMNTAGVWYGKWADQGVPDGRGEVGSINGINGTLSGSPGAYTFTRSTTGDPYPTAGAVPFMSDWESTRRDWNQIIMTGYNGAGAGTLEATQKMVDYQTSGDSLILSITTAVSMTAGTSGHTARVNINAGLKSVYGPKYFDVRGWLISNGLDAVGITPTGADNTALSGDTLPPSLMAADGVHPNAAGYRAIAIALNEAITQRGWK